MFLLTFSVWQTFVPPNLCLFLVLCPILNISIVSLSSSLNRFNALSACHELLPIGNVQRTALQYD